MYVFRVIITKTPMTHKASGLIIKQKPDVDATELNFTIKSQ